MDGLTGKQHVDRLLVLVFGVGVAQLLGVPNTTGTGRDQARCVVEALTEWNSTYLVVALALDTTSANTGHLSDACAVIDQTQK